MSNPPPLTSGASSADFSLLAGKANIVRHPKPAHCALPCRLLLLLAAAGDRPAAAEEAGPDSLDQEGLSATLERAGQAATEQTVEMVRWLSQRRQFTWQGVPYGFTGLPIVYYSLNTGWNYGVHLKWRDFQRRPYRYKATLHLLRSTRGKASYYFKLKVPQIPGTGFGARLWLGSKRDIRTRFYGLGNNSVLNEAFTDPQNPQFRDESYYYYILEAPRFIFSLMHSLPNNLATSVNLGIERSDVSKRGERAFFVDEGTPSGVKDGLTGFIGWTLSWDTRDDEDIPRSGGFHEWSFETSRSSLFSFLFEEIDFKRYTFTDARYWPYTERLNLAHRTVFEILDGAVPLYAYGEIGGSRRLKGLGGSEALRGYDRQHFTDNIRFFTNSEMRYQLTSFTFFGQYLEWHGVFFIDGGRVWSRLDQLRPTQLRWTTGGGLRLYWDEDFVVRLEGGFSKEQSYLGIKYRNLF